MRAEASVYDPESLEPLRRVDLMRARRRMSRDRAGSLLRGLAVTVFCLVIVVGLVMYLVGFRTYAITGGSMEGTISRGALIVDRIVPVSALQVGDIITFRPPGEGELVTHRIVSIDTKTAAQPLFRTKGDANESADPWSFTLDGDRRARYVFQIPYLGYVLLVFGSSLMRAVLLGGLALLLTVSLFMKLWREAGGAQGSDAGLASNSAVFVGRDVDSQRALRRDVSTVGRKRPGPDRRPFQGE